MVCEDWWLHTAERLWRQQEAQSNFGTRTCEDSLAACSLRERDYFASGVSTLMVASPNVAMMRSNRPLLMLWPMAHRTQRFYGIEPATWAQDEKDWSEAEKMLSKSF